MERKEAYTLTEVEEILQVKRRTLYNWINSGRLNAVKVGAGWRVTREEIDRVLTEGIIV